MQVTPVGWDEAGVQRVRMLDHLGSDVAAICLDCQIGEADGTPLKLGKEGLTSCTGNKSKLSDTGAELPTNLTLLTPLL